MHFKKISSIFLAVALILSMLPIIGSAENTEIFKVGVEAMTAASTISDSPIIYNQGDEITVKISASQNSGLTYLQLRIDYDETVLEPVEGKYTATELFTQTSEDGKQKGDRLTKKMDANGDRWFSFFFNSGLTATHETGVFAEITFIAKETCAAETGITIELVTPNSCGRDIVTDYINVPMEYVSDSFAIHKIDKTTGIVTPPTCTDEGYTTYPCADCKENIAGNIVAETGHDWADAVVENREEPTCTKEGSYELAIYCKVCGAEKPDSRVTKTITMLDHDPAEAVEENRKEATCTKEGSYDLVVYCKDCNAELSRETKTIAVIDHDPAEAIEENRKEATCTKEGSYDLVVYCKDCNAELSRETKTVPTVSHKLVHHDAQKATHTQIGWDEYDTCEDCDYTTYVEIPMVPYIAGDVTGDDEVTDADAVYLLYATFYPEKYPLNQDADYNGDGEVTDADAVYLLYATFYPEKYPLTKTEVK